MLQLQATEVEELRDQVSSLQESITQARFQSDDPVREVELVEDLRELVEDLKAELEDSQAEVDSLSGVRNRSPPPHCHYHSVTIPPIYSMAGRGELAPAAGAQQRPVDRPGGVAVRSGCQ